MKQDLLGLKPGDIPENYQRVDMLKLDKDNFCFQSCKSLEQAPFRCSDGTRSYNSFSTL